MSNVIPQRKPGTPLNQFYALGKYDGSLNRHTVKVGMGKAGLSATLNERNSNDVQEVPIKPQIHSSHDRSYYKPYKYLAARKEHDDMGNKSESRMINNMEVNRIYNMKKSNKDRVNLTNDGSLKFEPTDQHFGRTKML